MLGEYPHWQIRIELGLGLILELEQESKPDFIFLKNQAWNWVRDSISLEIGTNFLKLNVLEKKLLDLRGLTRS
jgi:hypothetical protein